MDDPTLEQSLALLLSQVPQAVQNFILNELGNTSLDLMIKHKLHVDQADVLERELLLLLLGQVTPAEFSTNLQASGISPETTRNIVHDVNEQVFKKLRDEQRAAASTPPEVYRTPPARVDVPVLQVGASATTDAPIAAPAPVPPQPDFNLMRPEILAAVQQQPVATTLPGSRAPVPPPLPHPRTMQSDIEMLQHPQAASSMPTTPHPWQTSPARSFQTASVPYTSVPYPSEPVAAPAPNTPPAAPQPAPNTPPIAPIAPAVPQQPRVNPLTHEYNLDPYREPIE